MTLPRYQTYSDSGVAWIGPKPTHWTTTRLKFLLAGIGSGGTPDTDNAEFWAQDEHGTAWVAIGDLSDREVVEETAKSITAAGVASKGLQVWPVGTLLFSMYASLGHTAVLAVPAATNQAILALLPRKEVNQKFLRRWLEFLKPKLKEHASSNTQDNLNAEKVRNLVVLNPPLHEQAEIAAFLDRETEKIDSLIAEQERLITLLAEKRQATISHAVTRGLNPSAPLKQSGVVGLGSVPAHWHVGPLKRFWSVTDCKHITAEFIDDGYPLASIREVQSTYVTLEHAKRTTLHFYEQLIDGGRKPMPGDLLFSRNATVGEVAQVTAEHPPFAMGQDVCLLRKLHEELSSDFLQAVIRSSVVVEQLKNLMVGSTFKRVNVEEIRGLKVPMPPYGEQVAISSFIRTETVKLDNLHAQAESAIGLLRERRSALIAAAVTGQIDVRNAIPQSTLLEELAV